MAELQFELLVLRSSFYIKQIMEVVAHCHCAHENPEVLRVTHAPMQKETMWHLNYIGHHAKHIFIYNYAQNLELRHLCSSCTNISVIVFFHHTSGYPIALTWYVLNSELRSRQVACTVVSKEPRRTSQKHGHATAQMLKMLSPHISV